MAFIHLLVAINEKTYMKHIFIILVVTALFSCSENKTTSLDQSTDFFEFKSHYWVNLHHFLYQKADSSQLRKLEEDGSSLLEIGEINVYEQLSRDEKDILKQAIQYYKDSLISKSLRRDLNDMRIWFINKARFETIKDNIYGDGFIEIINQVSPIYRKHFWEIHKSHNLSVISKHKAVIDEIEEAVISKMERLSLNKWPDSTKVRVDVTAYANWAGAYTSSKPEMNIVLSTLDPNNLTSSFVETILHEGSHLLYLFGESPIRDKIYFKSEEIGMDFPRDLWHASMFYLCGLATQEELSNLNIKHEMLMEEKNIFSNYNSKKFRGINDDFYNDRIDADTMILELLNEIKEKSH